MYQDPRTAISKILGGATDIRDATGMAEVSIEIGVDEEDFDGVRPFIRIRGEDGEIISGCYLPDTGRGPFGRDIRINPKDDNDCGNVLWHVMAAIASVLSPPLGYRWDKEAKKIVQEAI